VAKYRSLMPSLALIGHLIDSVDGQTSGPVSRAAAARAIAWCEYLHGHARRLYATVTDMARVAAALLGAKLTHGRLPSPFTAEGEVGLGVVCNESKVSASNVTVCVEAHARLGTQLVADADVLFVACRLLGRRPGA
jgi:hypothetical protein